MTEDAFLSKKTPIAVSDFEREQLLFFLTQDNVGQILENLNPSLAWLPDIQKLGVPEIRGHLVRWIERNFQDLDAIREVAANLKFFDADSGELMEHSLNQHADSLSPLLLKSWRLIVQAMKQQGGSRFFNDWFQLAPSIRRGEPAPHDYQRLAEIVRPRLRIEKRLSLYRQASDEPTRPSDLMSISFRTDGSAASEDILTAWSASKSAEADHTLLSYLTDVLAQAIAEAMDAGLETDDRFSISDADIPSVAEHPQNAYHGGFLLPVRVIVGVWDILVGKAKDDAEAFVHNWSSEGYRLFRRMALYACADSRVPANDGATLLASLSPDELFLTGSTVECVRLLRARWSEFSIEKQTAILNTICEGPAEAGFVNSDDAKRIRDRARFDLLGDFMRQGHEIDARAKNLFTEIQSRWPQWQLRPSEQIGFHVWHSSGSGEIVATVDFDDVPDEELIAAVAEHTKENDFNQADHWGILCRKTPDRACGALLASASKGEWPSTRWQALLSSLTPFKEPAFNTKIATLLMDMPEAVFAELVMPLSAWLGNRHQLLARPTLWAVWDRAADIALGGTRHV